MALSFEFTDNIVSPPFSHYEEATANRKLAVPKGTILSELIFGQNQQGAMQFI